MFTPSGKTATVSVRLTEELNGLKQRLYNELREYINSRTEKESNLLYEMTCAQKSLVAAKAALLHK